MKINGIKAICQDSKSLCENGYGPGFLELFFDKGKNLAFANYQVSQNRYTRYDDANIIACGWITRPATMEEIQEQVESTLMYK